MSQQAVAPAAKTGSWIRKAFALMALAAVCFAFVWSEAHWHWLENNLPDASPDKHLIKETKEVLGDTIENKEERLLNRVRRNPDAGIEDVNQVVSVYRDRIGRVGSGSPPSASVSVPPPDPTTSGVKLPIPAASVISAGMNKWEVVLPGNLEYHTGIKVSTHQNVVFSGWTGEVKLDPRETYINPPSGAFPADKVKLTFAEPWVKFDSWTAALLARVMGQDYADVGGRVSSEFQTVTDGEVILSINCLAGERNMASGSFHGTIEVR
jgi:hypothetical protein